MQNLGCMINMLDSYGAREAQGDDDLRHLDEEGEDSLHLDEEDEDLHHSDEEDED